MGGGSIHGSTAARKLLQHSIASSHPDATLSSSSLNTAMVIQDQDQDSDREESKIQSTRTSTAQIKAENGVGGESNGKRATENGEELLDMAFNGDELEELINSGSSSSGSSSRSSSPNHSFVSDSCAPSSAAAPNKQISVSLTNLPFSTTTSGAAINASEPNLISKELFENNINMGSRDTTLYTKSLSEEVLTELERKKKYEEDEEDEDEDEEEDEDHHVHLPVITIEKPATTTTLDKKTSTSLPSIVMEQQKLIEFEPLEALNGPSGCMSFENLLEQEEQKSIMSLSSSGAAATKMMPTIKGKENEEEHNEEDDDEDDEDEKSQALLQAALRRQSLFKLREKINGKVSRHVNEIEKRKLSPYRFSHSPLKQPRKLFKVSASSELAISPKTPLLVQESKSIRSVVGQICRPSNRMTRQQRSSKRLGSSSSQASTSQGFTSNLSSISENVSAVADLSSTTHDKSSSASPTAKHMFLSTQLKCATESIDL